MSGALVVWCVFSLLLCWLVGLLVRCFAGFLVCWLSVGQLSGPTVPGTAAGLARRATGYPPPSRQGEHGVLNTLAKFLPSSCPRSPKSSLDCLLPCRPSGGFSGVIFSMLGLCWPILAHLGPILAYLGLSWPHVGLSWAS